MSISFYQVKEVFCHYFSKRFLNSCSLSSLSGTLPHDANVGTLEVVPEAPHTILIFFIFFFCCSDWLFFCFLIFQITNLILGFFYYTADSL